MQNQQHNTEKLTERIPWKMAIIFGVVSFLLVFGLVIGLSELELLMQDDDGIEVDSEEAEVDEEPGFFTQRGWAFFGSHFVDIEASATTGFGDISESIDILDEWLEELPSILFHLVPIGVLVSLGFVFVKRHRELVQSESDGAIFGASIVAGYLPVVVFAILLFDWQVEIDEFRVVYEIPLVEGAIIAGILFPVLFGAIGGYLAYSRT